MTPASCIARWALLLAVLSLGSLAPASAQTGAEEPAAAAPSVPEPSAIAVPEVASRAEAVSTALRGVEAGLAPRPGIAEIEMELPKLAAEIEARRVATETQLAEAPALERLKALENEWRSLASPLPAWSGELTRRARDLEEELAGLDARRRVWELTREAVRESGAPEAVRERVEATLADLAKTRTLTEARRTEVLTLQSRVSEQESRTAEAIAGLGEARGRAVKQLLAADAPPLWSTAFRAALGADLGGGMSALLPSDRRSLADWARSRGSRMGLHVLLLAGLALLFSAARRHLEARRDELHEIERGLRIFQHPYAAAILIALLLSIWLYPLAPRAAQVSLLAAAILPAVVIGRSLLDPPLHPFLYALVAFFLADRVRDVLAPLASVTRLILVLELLAGALLLAWLLRPARLTRIPAPAGPSPNLRRAGVVGRLALAGLLGALIAETTGFSRLGAFLTAAVLESAYLLLLIYAVGRVLLGLALFAFRSEPLRRLGMVRRHRWLFESRIRRSLPVVATLAWAYLVLGNLELRDPLFGALRSGLAAEASFGALRLSLGDILTFLGLIFAAWLLSRFLRFVLEEDVYPRTRLQRGIPYAISTLLHYLILLFGFFLAVAAAGVDLNRFALLAGAFGVGIGFGLQNVVNNFVSGLILLFERPVQIGDRVQIGELWGEVRRIGIRSSVVRTFDGAEVIVPNGSLISETVTNWTLSDRHRRIEVAVGVAYGNDPQRVLDLLLAVAADHPDVITTPPPQALFQGFGDSSLDFLLRAWIREFDRGLDVRSQLGVAVSAALAEAGIEIPFPQRDLHLRSSFGSRDGVPASRPVAEHEEERE